MGVFALPLFVAGQQRDLAGPVKYSDPGNNFSSNVPINELSPRAYRRFHRRFDAVKSGEYWFKSTDGYKVSFVLGQHDEFAYYDLNGGFRYSMKYYDGKDIPQEAGEIVRRRFPEYKIDLVTEVNDGQKTFYLVQILNPLFIKVLSVTDGRIDIIRELANGGARVGPAQASR